MYAYTFIAVYSLLIFNGDKFRSCSKLQLATPCDIVRAVIIVGAVMLYHLYTTIYLCNARQLCARHDDLHLSSCCSLYVYNTFYRRLAERVSFSNFSYIWTLIIRSRASEIIRSEIDYLCSIFDASD